VKGSSMSQITEIGVNEGERIRNRRNAIGVVNELDSRFDELREAGDVHPGSMASLFGVTEVYDRGLPGSVFLVVGYDAADTVFRQHEIFSSLLAYAGGALGDSILGMDEPEHRKYRALALPAFALRTMASWRDRWLSPALDSLIDAFENESRADLYYGYCAKFPALTIGSAFGAKPEEVEALHDLVLRAGGGANSPEEVAAASEQFVSYLRVIMADRKLHPSDDVISLLLGSEYVDDDGSQQKLSEDEILGFADLMLTAGSGTTYRTMGTMLLALMERPELFDLVRADRSLVTKVVEETLRWEPPVTNFPRVSKVDTELAGVFIPAGSLLEVGITAANHDPRKWDRPHEFDPFRTTHPHLAFASGPHFCIGNQLARMEMGEALNRLMDRFTSIELDPEQPRPYRTGLLLRMPTGLPAILRRE
jgi:cytochrome P450